MINALLSHLLLSGGSAGVSEPHQSQRDHWGTLSLSPSQPQTTANTSLSLMTIWTEECTQLHDYNWLLLAALRFLCNVAFTFWFIYFICTYELWECLRDEKWFWHHLYTILIWEFRLIFLSFKVWQGDISAGGTTTFYRFLFHTFIYRSSL